MLSEALPEKDWTPWQREIMRGWTRLWNRDDQWLRIERWKLRQAHTQDWVCLADIAYWCAQSPGDLDRDHRGLMLAYLELQQSIARGEFSKGGRLKVLYLEPQPPSLRDPVRLRLNPEWIRGHDDRVLDHVLEHCWAPRELCVRWLLARRFDVPPWLAAPGLFTHAEQAEKAATSPVALAPEASTSPIKARASKERVHSAITNVYAAAAAAGKKSPNIKEIVPLVKAELCSSNEIAGWELVQQCAREPLHDGKRRPAGRTFKSEQIRRSES
jgi:hypothetical protein